MRERIIEISSGLLGLESPEYVPESEVRELAEKGLSSFSPTVRKILPGERQSVLIVDRGELHARQRRAKYSVSSQGKDTQISSPDSTRNMSLRELARAIELGQIDIDRMSDDF